MEILSAWIIDIALVLALTVTTVAVVGLYRFDEPYLRIHAVSNATFAGVVPLFVAILAIGDLRMIARATVIILFLIIVLPVSVHAIGRARYLRDESDDRSPRDGRSDI